MSDAKTLLMARDLNGWLKSLALILVLTLASCFLFSSHASAISPVFPDSEHNPDNVNMHATVSRLAPNSGLYAPQGTFKVFIGDNHASSQVEIKILNACPDRTGDIPDTRLTVEAFRTTSGRNLGSKIDMIGGGDNTKRNYPGNGDCNGSGQIVFNLPRDAFNNAQEGRYGSNWRTALIYVYKVDAGGEKSFRVQAPTGVVSFDDLSVSGAGGSYHPDQPGTSAFAIQNTGAPGNSPESRYKFTFRADCEYSSGQNVWLKWYDADASGQGNEQGDIGWKLTNASGTEIARRQKSIHGAGALGGQDEYKSFNVGPLNKNATYTWEWFGVDKSNGVQLWMPFNEITAIVNCNDPPPVEPPASQCDQLRFTIPNDGRTTPSGSSPDRRHFAVWVNDGSSSGTPGVNYVQNGSGYASPIAGGSDYTSYSFLPESNGIQKGRNIQIDLKTGAIYIMNDNWTQIVSHRDTNKTTLKSGTLQATIVVFNTYNSGSGDRIKVWERWTNNVNNCYQASCAVDIVETVPGAPNGSNAVNGQGTFNAFITIFNNSPTHPLPWRIGGTVLGATRNSGNWHGINTISTVDIPPGGSRTIPLYNLDPQDNVGTQWLNPYPDYYGVLAIGGGCNTPVNVYRQYETTIVPDVILNPSDEDPSQAIFKSTISLKQDPGVGFNIHHNMRSTRNGNLLNSRDEAVAAPGEVVYQTDPRPTSGGDNYCVDVFSNQGKGWVGPGGAILGAERIPPTGTLRDCSIVYDRPYLSVYGSDAIAGSNFKNGKICNPTGNLSSIRTFRSPVGGKSGSGAQFAAIALGQISGFTSARLYNPPKGLSFANTETVAGMFSNEQPDDGGHFADPHLCATDFWNGQKQPEQIAGTHSTYNIQNLTDVKESIINANATTGLRINGSGYNKNTTLYVNGDVILTNNIAYNLTKNFKLVVRGNIYIDKSVNRLDGLYVAQPNADGQGGNIYTCTNGKNLYGTGAGNNELFVNCRPPSANQLVINGAFVAKSVKFLRTNKSLRDSSLTEVPNGSPASNAAEVFNFSPEIYLYTSGGDNSDDEGPLPYNYITTLPPIL